MTKSPQTPSDPSSTGETDESRLEQALEETRAELREARREKQQREAEAVEYYEEMFRKNTAPKLLIDPESGYIADANPAALAFYDYSLEAIRNRRIQDINLLSEAEVEAEWEKARHEERRYFEFRHQLADGEIRDVKVYSGPIEIGGRQYLHSIIHDVTEATRYQAQLERYKAIFDTLPVGVYRNKPGAKGQFEEVNPAMAHIFGADSVDELLRHTTAELYTDPDQRQAFSEALLQTGELHRYELDLQTLDGRPLRAAITARLRHTDDGEPFFDGVVEDVTERYRAEQEREQALAILEATPDFVSMARTDGHITYVNRGGLRMLGEDPERTGLNRPLPEWLQEERAGELAHPQWARQIIKDEGLATAARQGSWQGESAMVDAEGHEIPASQVILAHYDERGAVSHFSTILRDISAQRALEAELRRETAFSNAVLRNLPGVFYMIDADGRFVRWNRRMEAVTGHEADEGLAAVPPTDLFPESEQGLVAERIRQVFAEGAASVEAHLCHRDGTPTPYYLTGYRVALEGETYLLGAGLDISDRKAAEAELERSNAELDAFAYAVSHDLQEPLRVINSYLGLLQRRYGDALDERAGRYITATTDAAERMRRMIQDLLEYSRIKRMGEDFQPVDLNEVAEEARSNLETAISDSSAEIAVDTLPSLEGDRGQLVRLLQNLLSNAIKYGPTDDVLRITVHSTQQDGFWEIAVADNGLGIDPDQADRVFGVFQRLHTRDEHEGTGAGLALAQRIVERHGGQIWVESEGEGSGSTFRFTLPAAEAPRSGQEMLSNPEGGEV